jgi:uncharacterized membrane protein YeaQ/YmgE (transglycosylase-associated protein family)
MTSSIRKPLLDQTSFSALLLLLFAVLIFWSQSLSAADDAGVTKKAEDMAKETGAAVEKAGTAAADTAKSFWEKIDAARLKNRTPDELVAWVIMGALVGSIAGMMTSLKPTGFGRLARLMLGLAGAFIGGIVVHLRNFDFGWGPVLIRYEELFFSFVGAIVLVVLGKLISSRMKKKDSTH